MQQKVQQGEEHTSTLHLRTQLWQGKAIHSLVTDSPVRLVNNHDLAFHQSSSILKEYIVCTFHPVVNIFTYLLLSMIRRNLWITMYFFKNALEDETASEYL